MPQALITRSVQLTQEDWQLVEDFKHEHQLKSWSKAFVAILAQWSVQRVLRKKR